MISSEQLAFIAKNMNAMEFQSDANVILLLQRMYDKHRSCSQNPGSGMKIYLNCDHEEKKVYIYGRGPKPVGAAGYRDLVVPGDHALGRSYDELMALGTGEHEVLIAGEQSPPPNDRLIGAR